MVYDPRRDDNEERSAAEAERVLRECGAPPSPVPALVRATAHRTEPFATDERILTDVDLAILGRPAEQFDEYERRIRLEYEHVPDRAFAAGRARVLRHFLRRTHVYSTAEFRDRYEASARENLRRALARWADRTGPTDSTGEPTGGGDQ